MKDFWELLGVLLLIGAVYLFCAGITVGGKHYGVADCNDKQGVVVDMGEPRDAGAPEGGL